MLVKAVIGRGVKSLRRATHAEKEEVKSVYEDAREREEREQFQRKKLSRMRGNGRFGMISERYC